MPSMALSAIRTIIQAGTSANTQGYCAKPAITAPTSTEPMPASSVIWLAVVPLSNKRRTRGRRRFWKAGLIW
ncbi:hypothetical protein D3C80_1763900 [compost metagenome]